jgi:6-phosphogluconolactonase
MAPTPELVVLPDAFGAARAAAEDIAQHVQQAVAERGVAHVAVSGGDSPIPMFEVLAGLRLPWDRLHLYQVDERVAPDGHEDRNAEGLRWALLERAPIPREHVHLMPVTADDLQTAADEYGALLPDAFDVVHLGIGDDGHTASWPPEHPVLEVTDRAVEVVGPFNGRLRMTLTPPAVARGRRIVWLVDGGERRTALERLLAGDPATPATHAKRDNAIVFCDGTAHDGS